MRIIFLPAVITLATHLLLFVLEVSGTFTIPPGKKFLVAWLTCSFGGIYLALKTYRESDDLRGFMDSDTKEALGGCVGAFFIVGLLIALVTKKSWGPVAGMVMYAILIPAQYAIWPPFGKRLAIYAVLARIPEIMILFLAAHFSWNEYQPVPIEQFNRYLLFLLPFTFLIGSLMGMIATLIGAGAMDRRRTELAETGAVLEALSTKSADPESNILQRAEGMTRSLRVSNIPFTIVLFRDGSDAPPNPENYQQQVVRTAFKDKEMQIGRWRMVGLKSALSVAETSVLYKKMVVEGKIDYFGNEVQRWEGRGPDGKNVVALLFSQEKAKPAAITEKDLEYLASYWRHSGKQWWKEQLESRTEAICDYCNVTLQRDAGYKNGSYLFCSQCCDNMLSDAIQKLKQNVNHFGQGILAEARLFAGES